MAAVKLATGIYWVGGIDWNLRSFHGYLTQRGSTYNAYLIVDEKIVLVDTVKHYLYDEMVSRIKEVIDPSRIDYIVSNHTEMDHSGCLPKILRLAKNAVVIASPNGEKGLKKHFLNNWNFKIVKTGDVINIGKRTIKFVLAPMVHWPDSMVTYIPEEKILLSNDAFGQHIASFARFDDETELGIVKEEAAKYYANIVLPFGKQVKKLLSEVSCFDIKMIASSHGVIWRTHTSDIVELYKKWADNVVEKRAVIIYDTMWGSTERIAYAISEVFSQEGIPYSVKSLQTTHISDIMTEILSAKYICVGSPTLNNEMLPPVASFLTYLKGLAPRNRIGIAFGSYGWGGQSIAKIGRVFMESGFRVPVEGFKIQYVPHINELEDIKSKVREVIKEAGDG